MTRAQDAAEFYRGRTVSLVIGHEVGTGYDLYGRVLARHLGRHIPGNPAVTPQNLVGGGGLHSANWLATVAPRDGATIAIFAHSAILEPLLGAGTVKYRSTDLSWIGNMDETSPTCVVTQSTGVASFAQLIARETVYGGSGGPLSQFPAAVLNLFGAKGRLVQGYKGSADIRLAMLRGEIEATCGLSISTIQTQWRADVEAGRIRPVAQFGRTPNPKLAGITFVYALAKGAEDTAVFDLVFGGAALGRPLAAPPAVPKERVEALRAAFMATMSDPAFKADAAEARLDFAISSGAQVQALVERFFASSPAVVERAKASLRVR